MANRSQQTKAFTLIELLIVVAIIAILAAIAVPNFLEAQTRSKVSRTKADMRSLATGLEAYRVDSNAYPKCNNFALALARVNPDERSGAVINAQRRVLERLSTPISYMTNGGLPDPFVAKERTGTINSTDGTYTPVTAAGDPNEPIYKLIKYATPGEAGLQDVESATDSAKWAFVLVSAGPDLVYPNLGGIFAPAATAQAALNNVYDPTNGTVSSGDVYRTGGVGTGVGNYGGQFLTTVGQSQN